MKTHRRIEITAFRRRVIIVSGGKPINNPQTDESVCINDADTNEAIELESDEGQRILLKTVRLLEEKLAHKEQKKD